MIMTMFKLSSWNIPSKALISTHFLKLRKQLYVSMPKIKLNQSAEIPPEISKHFGPEPFKNVPIEKQTFYCKDSRGDSENFGAPGGDFGEFLLALNCWKKRLTGGEVDEMFEKWIDERCSKTRPFYLHSDLPALTRTFTQIGFTESIDPRDINESHVKEQFIETFCSGGEFQGCGHLRLIMEKREDYLINLETFSYLARSFFHRYFGGDDRLMFKVYTVPQEGCALLVINGSDSLKSSIVSTQCISGDHQVFILNQHAVSSYRKHFLVPFFLKNEATKTAEEMFKEMEEVGWNNAMMSANTLAGGKPIYNVQLENE